MIERRHDWRERLAEHIASRRSRPFDWASGIDCGLSVADAVQAMTGHDIAAPLRGYRSQFGALRAVKRAGFDSVAAYLDSFLCRTRKPRAGDIIALNLDQPLTPLAIADGRGGAWGPDAGGLVRVRADLFARAWSI